MRILFIFANIVAQNQCCKHFLASLEALPVTFKQFLKNFFFSAALPAFFVFFALITLDEAYLLQSEQNKKENNYIRNQFCSNGIHFLHYFSKNRPLYVFKNLNFTGSLLPIDCQPHKGLPAVFQTLPKKIIKLLILHKLDDYFKNSDICKLLKFLLLFHKIVKII